MAETATLRRQSTSGGVADRRATGSFYTPKALAEWCARLLLELGGCKTVVDFGCGDGALLGAMRIVLPDAKCVGVELNAFEASRARNSLGSKGFVTTCDVLNPPDLGQKPLASYWRGRVGHSRLSVIMNPPWGADHALDVRSAAQRGLSLASGQYDTYDLFCEMAVSFLKNEENFVFILPDSIFLPEHRKLRQLFLEFCELSLVARLGEGIFEGVYRGTVVIAGVRRSAKVGHRVECLRITKAERAQIAHSDDFERYRKRLAHFVLQQRFADDRVKQFDIDVREADEAVAKMNSAGSGWTHPLWSNRGVEISKTGKVLVCVTCGDARPLPKLANPRCLSCAAPLQQNSLIQVIAKSRPKKGPWAPFIAGEDVRRYSVQPSRWIMRNVSGINYKSDAPNSASRLLVRKTGIGLNASVFSDSAYTNQVVFEYGLRSGHSFDFNYLHYVLGVMCSRVMFAYHLRRTGDSEWRSHPYVTQKTLADLPIPQPRPGTHQWRQASAIAKAVGQRLRSASNEIEIEALVGGLYGLSTSDMRWALDVIDDAADLEAMRSLRLPRALEIVPITVR